MAVHDLLSILIVANCLAVVFCTVLYTMVIDTYAAVLILESVFLGLKQVAADCSTMLGCSCVVTQTVGRTVISHVTAATAFNQ